GTMQHLVCGDVVQHQADSLCGVQSGWHRNQFVLRQADELSVGTAYWQRGHDLAWFDSRDTVATLVHHANQIPSGGEGERRRLGMNALAHHEVGQGDTCSQHSHPNFTSFRFGALFFNDSKSIRPAVVSDDDSSMSHGARPLYGDTLSAQTTDRWA